MPTWSDYIQWLGDAAVQRNPPNLTAPEPDSFWTDSRDIKPRQWFVPIVGESFDGHKFIETAIAKGAAGFFYDKSHLDSIPKSLLQKGFGVTDTLVAMQRCATGWRRSLRDLKILALTGSSGKTTTKEMLSSILYAHGPALATHGSFNNEIGVPKTLLQLKPNHQSVALEFGARHPGDIRFLTRMAEPNIVALLNVGTAHLGIFGSADNLLQGKLEIFRDSPPNAVQVPFHDDERILQGAVSTGKKIVSFGKHKAATVTICSETWHADGTMSVTLSVAGSELNLMFKNAHEAYSINAAAACAMALAAEIDLKAMKKGLDTFRGIKGRYQVHQLSDVTLIDDCYNANPESMALGFKTLAKAFADKRKIIVLGDMLELGDDSAKEHEKIGRLCVETLHPDLLVTVGKDSRYIVEGAKKAGQKTGALLAFENVDKLIGAEKQLRAAGDVLYVKASNGIRLSKFIDHLLEQK